jgi:hypothetical protein
MIFYIPCEGEDYALDDPSSKKIGCCPCRCTFQTHCFSQLQNLLRIGLEFKAKLIDSWDTGTIKIEE